MSDTMCFHVEYAMVMWISIVHQHMHVQSECFVPQPSVGLVFVRQDFFFCVCFLVSVCAMLVKQLVTNNNDDVLD